MKTSPIADLVSANRILAHHGILDAFGHISMRSPAASDRFLIARSMAPAHVGEDDIMTLTLGGDPVGGDDRQPYLERFIHSEIYRARPDVHAVLHSHSPSTIPYGVVAIQPLRPIYHMAAGAGSVVPIFDIAVTGGDATDMLIRNAELGASLAVTLAEHRAVLMRGHGLTIAAGTVKAAVFIGIYMEMNARLQTTAMQMGPVKFLTSAEVEAAWQASLGVLDRAWDLWLRDIV